MRVGIWPPEGRNVRSLHVGRPYRVHFTACSQSYYFVSEAAKEILPRLSTLSSAPRLTRLVLEVALLFLRFRGYGQLGPRVWRKPELSRDLSHLLKQQLAASRIIDRLIVGVRIAIDR